MLLLITLVVVPHIHQVESHLTLLWTLFLKSHLLEKQGRLAEVHTTAITTTTTTVATAAVRPLSVLLLLLLLWVIASIVHICSSLVLRMMSCKHCSAMLTVFNVAISSRL
jgi:hypothetical protein